MRRETKTVSLCLVALGLISAGAFAAGTADSISPALFRSPPREYGPYVWWHWMNGNVTKEGITADLEALAESGIAGATLFDESCGIEPAGPVRFGTESFLEHIRHACKESRRLGLKLAIVNSTGWANAGGPWVPPEDSMKFVTVSETPVTGPCRFDGVLGRIAENRDHYLKDADKDDVYFDSMMMTDDHGFYEDIAVLAVRGIEKPIPAQVDLETGVATARMDGPKRVAGFSWKFHYPWKSTSRAKLIVEASEDGTSFRPVETVAVYVDYFNSLLNGPRRHTFRRPVSCRALRVTAEDEAGRRRLAFDAFAPEADQHLEDVEGKCLRYRFPLAETAIDESVTPPIRPEEIVNLTARMDRRGRLVWNVPPGEWTILRVGYHANGKMVSSSGTLAGRGPEVDKLAVGAVERHFEAGVGRLMRLLGEDGKAITGVLNDSFEAGSQNWTRGLEREFETLRGYSPIPYLPAFTGRIIGSVEETERFLKDFREVLYELFARNFAGTMLRKCHEYGLEAQLEPYGNGPTEDVKYTRYCDLPMAEFWSTPRTEPAYNVSTGPILGSVEQVVAAADLWNHGIIAAEAFTASPGNGRWQVTPHAIKAQGDRAFLLGINRLYIQRFCHQPWKTPRLPGMTMGPWGMHFDRTQTWWPEAKEYVRYVTRCQCLLQSGCKVKGALCHRRDKFADWYFVASTNLFPTEVEVPCDLTGRVPEIWYPETGETVRAATWRVEGESTVVNVKLSRAGSAFVVFRNANPDVPPERVLCQKTVRDLATPWRVTFFSPLDDGPASRTFGTLAPWNESEDDALRHFSGSAVYETTLDLGPILPGERLFLDLGEVCDFATVALNGRTYRALWKPPYEIDVTEAVRPGANALAVRVTNRWPNRLIGDARLRPEQRKTWTSWPHWGKDDKLLKSGLLGPVRVRTMMTSEMEKKD